MGWCSGSTCFAFSVCFCLFPPASESFSLVPSSENDRGACGGQRQRSKARKECARCPERTEGITYLSFKCRHNTDFLVMASGISQGKM